MAEMSPENIQKLIQNRVRAQTAVAADGVGGLSAGDKMDLLGGFERIVNMALSGSDKMGGRAGILQQFTALISDFSEGVQDEMTGMFNKVFKRFDDLDEESEEPVEVDEKQFKTLQKEGITDAFNSRILKSLQVQRGEQLKGFLKNNFINSLFKSKMFQGLVGAVKNVGNMIKVGFTRFMDIVVPGLQNIFKTLVARTAAIMARMSMVLFSVITAVAGAVISIVSFIFTTVVPMLFTIISFILFTVIPAIVSGIIAVITFLAPIAVAVAAILLKALLIVGVIFLVLFALWKAWEWLNTAFPEAIQAVKDFFKSVWEGAKELWAAFIEGAKIFWGWLETAATAAWDAAGKAWDWLYNNVGELVTWVGDMFLRTWDWLKGVPVIGSVFMWIENTLMDLAKNLHKLFFGDGPFFTRLVDFFLDTQLFKDLASLGNWILDTFKSAWETVYGWIEGIYEWTIGAIDAVGETVTSVAETTWDVTKTVGQGIWEGTKAVGSALNPLNWFAKGGIVDEPTLAVIGEKLGTSEAVIPLNSQGIGFMADAIAKSNLLGSDNFFMNLAYTEIETLKNTFDIKSAMGRLYEFVTGDEFNYGNLTSNADNINPMQWLAEGGIVVKENIVGVGEEGPEMVIPLNSSGAEFVKSVLQDELYAGGEGGSKLSDVDNKLNALMRMMKTGRSQNGTPINTNKPSEIANYVDMIAKGIIG